VGVTIHYILMRNHLLLICLLLCGSSSFSQRLAKITITHPKLSDGTVVKVYQPFGRFANNLTVTSEVVAKNGLSEISLPLAVPGVVKFQSAAFTYKLFIAEGDTIRVDGKPDNTYSISGSNSDGQYYVMRTPPLGRDLDPEFDAVIAPASRGAAIVDSVEQCMRKYKSIYNALFSEGKITPSLHQYFMVHVEAITLMYTYMRYSSYLEDDNPPPAINKMPPKWAILDGLNRLYTKYDAFDAKYQVSQIQQIIAGNKLRLTGQISGPSYIGDKAKWDVFREGNQIYATAPDSIQEWKMASLILSNISHGDLSKEILDKYKQTFNQYYPNSVWTDIVEREFAKVPDVAHQRAANSKMGYYIEYNGAAGGIKMVQNTALKTINDIEGLVRLLANGKPLMVDCWATWCGPCVAQFRHSEELHRFLDSSSVNMLYLSFDSPANRKIFPTINDYKLDGMHYVASNEIIESIAKIYNVTTLSIPKYLLFDKDAKLLHADLELPGSGARLYGQIKQLLEDAGRQ
jgi:Thiol-disulfide isomerase and thioredoxins